MLGLLAVLPFLAGALAAPQPVPVPDRPNLLREQLGARILAELAKRTDKPPSALARQLLGGGDSYAPYEIPCPSDVTWIRPADVSSFAQSSATHVGSVVHSEPSLSS